MNAWPPLHMPPGDPDQLAADLGISITYWPHLPCLGVYARADDGAAEIALRVDLQRPGNDRPRRVVLAHELGHAALHAGTLTSPLHCHRRGLTASRIEIQAERYAGELLCPVAFVRAYAAAHGTVEADELYELADTVEVPEAFIRWWIRELAGRGVLLPERW